ncbi:arsenate reductase family protein [Nonlabens ponticola]|uniref:ArsC family transcriptional regulator n=1 Tax=Nonlabens ponticola TaxID=2496866 RepID=A0A3S9MYZ2_9FLAO|nr:hypothetical protein [Nonlabens ponticola]AZQ44359.1 hypothetical protein EJ995_08950 [Nonlabens ponticola]
MISLATDEREIVLLYDSNNKNHREIYAYAVAAKKPLNAIDVNKQHTTGTQWSEIANKLDKDVKDLIDTDHSIFIEKHGKKVSLTNDGAIKLLQNDPEMLLFPIAVQGDKAKVLHLYGDMTDFIGPDTAAVNIP